jgi:hypothetical protein
MQYGSGAVSLFGGAASIYGALTVDEAVSLVGGTLSEGASIVGSPVGLWQMAKANAAMYHMNEPYIKKMQEDGNDFGAAVLSMPWVPGGPPVGF